MICQFPIKNTDMTVSNIQNNVNYSQLKPVIVNVTVCLKSGATCLHT